MAVTRRITISTTLLAALAAFVASAPGAAGEADGPVVVELFQSQGCSSCPPANAMLNRLADRADVLPLNFGVTYWDQLGWKDKFAHPAYTDRQWNYARAAKRSNVATPQFVINGRGVVTGSDARSLAEAIRAEDRDAGGPAITVHGKQIRIAPRPGSGPATVWLVRYDPRVRNVAIGRGENVGRVLPHRNVVTGLRSLGILNGKPTLFDQPAYRDAGQLSAVLVQQGVGGRIIAARTL